MYVMTLEALGNTILINTESYCLRSCGAHSTEISRMPNITASENTEVTTLCENWPAGFPFIVMRSGLSVLSHQPEKVWGQLAAQASIFLNLPGFFWVIGRTRQWWAWVGNRELLGSAHTGSTTKAILPAFLAQLPRQSNKSPCESHPRKFKLSFLPILKHECWVTMFLTLTRVVDKSITKIFNVTPWTRSKRTFLAAFWIYSGSEVLGVSHKQGWFNDSLFGTLNHSQTLNYRVKMVWQTGQWGPSASAYSVISSRVW